LNKIFHKLEKSIREREANSHNLVSVIDVELA